MSRQQAFCAIPAASALVALYLNRRLWPFTVVNSWTGSLSTAFNSWMELHLNRRQLRSLGGELPRIPCLLGQFELIITTSLTDQYVRAYFMACEQALPSGRHS
jgi:hypothetical protein